MSSNIPRDDQQDDYQRWAEQAAADEDAELMYRRMLEDEEAGTKTPAVEQDVF